MSEGRTAIIVVVVVLLVLAVAVVAAAAAHDLRYVDPLHIFHYVRRNL